MLLLGCVVIFFTGASTTAKALEVTPEPQTVIVPAVDHEIDLQPVMELVEKKQQEEIERQRAIELAAAKRAEELAARQRAMVQPQEISRDFNVFQPCGYSAEELASALSTDSHIGLLPYIDTLLEAEERFGVNAFYLLCKFGYESGWGRYMAADNNIGGWTDGKGGFRDFSSIEECILHIAENLSTVYREKVGCRLEDVSKRYCPNVGYVDSLIQIMIERTKAIEG